MLVHYTLIKVMPERVPQAVELLAGSRLIEYFLKAHGLRHGSLSECVDEPGRLLSLSMWVSVADAQATFAHPEYAALLGDLQAYLIRPPERQGYKLLKIVRHK